MMQKAKKIIGWSIGIVAIVGVCLGIILAPWFGLWTIIGYVGGIVLLVSTDKLRE